VARALAVEVVTEKAFEPIGEEACRRALETMSRCKRVICCLSQFGAMNRKNLDLLDYARRNSLLADVHGLEQYAALDEQENT